MNNADRNMPGYKPITPKSFSQFGFSLLEMAIVLLVIGLLLGGALVPLSVQIEKRDRDTTRSQLLDMREALVGYALVNGRLPCPDSDGDGFMDIATTCNSDEGDYPWADLGLGKEDAWGRAFSYRVSGDFADTTDGTGCATSPTAGLSFSLCSVADISVFDGAAGNAVAGEVPAIIISHGKNWAITSSEDEAENTDNDSDMVDRVYSSSASPTFDDLVVWVVPNILKSKMVSVGLVFGDDSSDDAGGGNNGNNGQGCENSNDNSNACQD
ncbi:MAG: prepilin-type N-terminal cleavage/methylation domain-containing protein [Candidatus Reddybacter sp.]